MPTATAPRPTLNVEKIREHVESMRPVVGGWSSPIKDNQQEASHYFRATTDADGNGYHNGTALCGYIDVRNELDVDEVDPLAPENCRECRRKLLELRRLI